ASAKPIEDIAYFKPITKSAIACSKVTNASAKPIEDIAGISSTQYLNALSVARLKLPYTSSRTESSLGILADVF
ncbi:hypothetical protein, partial [Nostoc sp.]|uniref:hypothetical protein n=1 Tax=Nostoc sp. TaxID=1180 RepID=UPI002FF793C5